MAIILKITLIAIVLNCCSSSELPKPSYARTYLKVSRSLPGTTEEMKIRTTEGNLATLIVKKRNGTHIPNDYDKLNITNGNSPIHPITTNNNNLYDALFPNPIHVNREREGNNKMSSFVKLNSSRSNLTGGTKKRSGRMLNLNDALHTHNRQYTFLPHQPILRTNIGANAMINRGGKHVPEEVTVKSEVNIKSNPRKSTIVIDKDGIPIVYGRRVPDDPEDKYRTWRNARVINNVLVTDQNNAPVHNSPEANNPRFDRRSDNGRHIKNVYLGWEPESHATKYHRVDSSPQLHNDFSVGSENLPNAKEHKVVTHYGVQTSADNMKISPLPLKTGSRAPVLQYAHPEFGVQPAKVTRYLNDFIDGQFKAKNSKHDYTFKNKLSNEYNPNKLYNSKYYNVVESATKAPLWTKISQDLKNQLHSSVEKVSQFTKPIINPIMDMTYKSLNTLGLMKPYATEKIYSPVTSGSSILFPALGLVASGAALGLGAVAVGRYLDVDALTRFDNVEKMRYINSNIPVDQENMASTKENSTSMTDNTEDANTQSKQLYKDIILSKDLIKNVEIINNSDTDLKARKRRHTSDLSNDESINANNRIYFTFNRRRLR